MPISLRALARQFHAMAARACPDRKSLTSNVIEVRVTGGVLAFRTAFDEIVVEARHACEWPDQHHELPFAKLQDLVELPTTKGAVFTTNVLDEPARWSSWQSGLIPALRDAMAVTTREPMRYAIHRVQLIGDKGVAVGTDSRQVVIAKGIELPFDFTLLIPACKVFASRELAECEARIGLSRDHVIVEAGPWRFGFKIDRDGTYPDAFRVLPRSFDTTWRIADDDQLALRQVIERTGEGITFHLAPPDVKVINDNESVPLQHSTVNGQPLSVTLAAKNASRLIDLGLRTIRFAGPNKPFVAADRRRTYFAMMLDAAELAAPALTPSTPKPIMKNEPVNRHAPLPPVEDLLDPLVEAEALRNALGDVINRASRLLAALKSKRKEQKALSQVFSSLKALKLGNG